MVVLAEFGAAQPGEEAFRHVGAGFFPAIGFAVVDAVHGEAAIQIIPGLCFVGVDRGALGDARRPIGEQECEGFRRPELKVSVRHRKANAHRGGGETLGVRIRTGLRLREINGLSASDRDFDRHSDAYASWE